MRINWSNGYKDITPNDSSYRLRAIMGNNNVTLKFSLPEYIEFSLGSYINYEGQTYTLNTPQTLREINSTNFEYSLVLGSDEDKLSNVKAKDTEGRLKFPYTAKPQEHVKLLVDTLNKNDTGWSVGNYIEGNEKLISYNHTDCYDALQMIASEFSTEFEIIGKIINLNKVEYNKENPLALSYGKGNGFVSGVGRSNDGQNAGFNVLYCQGGERNIDYSKYGSRELLLPKNQEYTYEGTIYKTSADGLSIQKKGALLLNRIEESLDCSHLYPQRLGTISEVVVVDEENNFYDFKDNSIPENLDFSTLRMNGEKITIYFESGKLAGREFDIVQDDNVVNGYVHSERKFVLVPKEEDGFTMPNDVFIPEIGDTYSVFGMMMPDAYISDNASQTGASWDMLKEAVKYFYENEESKFTFKGVLDGIWSKSDWINIGSKIKIGGFVSFSDTKFQPTGIDIRISSVKDYLNNPYSPDIELSNSIQGGGISSDLDKIKESEVVVDSIYKRSLDFTKRYFRDSKETLKLLQAAQLNFEESISPITVETMALLVGDKSLQFRFVNAAFSETPLIFSFNESTKVFKIEGETLQHLTLGIDAVTPNPNYKTWDIENYESTFLAETDKSYYVYAKTSKTTNSGVFTLSETAIGLEEVLGHYHLLTGVLNTEYNGGRSFAKMFGFTEILPGQIKVDKLTSGNGAQVIELLEEEIRINASVTFTNDSPALEQTRQNTVSTLNIGGKNIILNSSQTKAYYSLSEDKRERYFNEERTFSISVDATAPANFSGYIFLIGLKENGDTFLIKHKDVDLLESKTKRLHITADFIISDYESVFVKVQNEADNIEVDCTLPQLELGEISTDWDISPEDIEINIATSKKAAELAAESYTKAQNSLLKTQQEAYADGIVTAEEERAIADATARRDEAKDYADAQDNLLKTQQEAYADGIVTDMETSLIAVAQSEANLAQTNAEAHADGIVTAEEQARIDALTQALIDAKYYADAQDISVINNSQDSIAEGMGYASFQEMETKASLGETLISGGLINTELINAVAVISKYMSTELLIANSIISDNNQNKVNVNANSGIPFEVFNSAGIKQLELFEVNGSVQFVYRNKSGDIIWFMGENGMEYSQFTAESWVTRTLQDIGTLPLSLSDFGLQQDYVTKEVTKNKVGVNYYEYVSATNSGTLVKPDEHGKTYTSKNYAGSIVSNGMYFDCSTTLVNKAMVGSNGEPFIGNDDVLHSSSKQYDKWYSIICHNIVDGKTSNTFLFIF
ncbi:TerB family tellurite resistance protein [Polaribacter sp. IC073]|uniref:TerB family tellurite resistance protein n=1 Tax=Polaribacter sp. IC073 TaxID=2508540 RepID=UPI0011BD6ADF|nr:TerB family tellurite resistance protein [Polaribacter sp. IC073]TXD47330.1 TerB family tellurite resistance protein [Polaribacter sp. IC073]